MGMELNQTTTQCEKKCIFGCFVKYSHLPHKLLLDSGRETLSILNVLSVSVFWFSIVWETQSILQEELIFQIFSPYSCSYQDDVWVLSQGKPVGSCSCEVWTLNEVFCPLVKHGNSTGVNQCIFTPRNWLESLLHLLEYPKLVQGTHPSQWLKKKKFSSCEFKSPMRISLASGWFSYTR